MDGEIIMRPIILKRITTEIDYNLFLHLHTYRPDNHTQPATQIPNASSST